jgi:vacuolar-type H+-ATPase subunit I/STV1
VECKKLRLKWGKSDHAELQIEIGWGEKRDFRYQDWVLKDVEFLTSAREMIVETLLDHSKEFIGRSVQEREEWLAGRAPREIERELTIRDIQEGITYSHVLMVVIGRAQILQKSVQLRRCGETRNRLDAVRLEIDKLQAEKERQDPNSQEFAGKEEEIASKKDELRNIAEEIERNKDTRISNFRQAKDGKVNTETFNAIREYKKGRSIQKLEVGGREIIDEEEIRGIMEKSTGMTWKRR